MPNAQCSNERHALFLRVEEQVSSLLTGTL